MQQGNGIYCSGRIHGPRYDHGITEEEVSYGHVIKIGAGVGSSRFVAAEDADDLRGA